MPTKYISTKEAWPKIAAILNLPELAVSGDITITLKQNDVVKVDFDGVIPERATEVDNANSP